MTYEEGWRAAITAAVAAVAAYSESWLPNGPSKAAANAIAKVISRVSPPSPPAATKPNGQSDEARRY